MAPEDPQEVPSFEQRLADAEQRYRKQIEWYEKTKADARFFHRLFQTIAVSLTGITPIVILATDSKLAQASPPALATLIAGIQGVYEWREAWRRRAKTVEALKSEYIKYKTRTGDYGSTLTKDEALNKFILNMEKLIASEVEEWGRPPDCESPPPNKI